MKKELPNYFESCNVNFQNMPRYTTYGISYRMNIDGILLEPHAIFFTLKGYFICNQDAICLN